jgi:hypothetical protein
MSFKHKVAYTAFGGLLMLIGIITVTAIKPSLLAQRGDTVNMGKITCTELVLVDDYGRKMGGLFSDKDFGGILLLTDVNATFNTNNQVLSADKSVRQGPAMLSFTDSDKLAITLSTIAGIEGTKNMRGLKFMKSDGISSCYLVGDDTGGLLGIISGGNRFTFPSLEQQLKRMTEGK